MFKVPYRIVIAKGSPCQWGRNQGRLRESEWTASGE